MEMDPIDFISGLKAYAHFKGLFLSCFSEKDGIIPMIKPLYWIKFVIRAIVKNSSSSKFLFHIVWVELCFS